MGEANIRRGRARLKTRFVTPIPPCHDGRMHGSVHSETDRKAMSFAMNLSLGIGLIISSRAPSAESANIVALLISFLPAFMLSGFAFPLSSIPPVLQALSYLFPGRYMVTIARAVFLKGGDWVLLWPQVAALALYAVLTIVIASALYRRRMA